MILREVTCPITVTEVGVATLEAAVIASDQEDIQPRGVMEATTTTGG